MHVCQMETGPPVEYLSLILIGFSSKLYINSLGFLFGILYRMHTLALPTTRYLLTSKIIVEHQENVLKNNIIL